MLNGFQLTLSVDIFVGFSRLIPFVCSLQYPDYVDAYLRLAAIAKARNNVQLSIELVVNLLLSPPTTSLGSVYYLL